MEKSSMVSSIASIPSDDEVSSGDELDGTLTPAGSERRSDHLVYWRPDSEDHPRNWLPKRKIFDTTIIILLEFYTWFKLTVISTTGAAVADNAGPEFGLGRRQALVAFTFIYQLGQALASLIIPPLSELLGRRKPYLLSTLLFALSCLLLAAIPSVPIIYLTRFLAGLASSVPSVVIAGSVEDLFTTKSRVWIVVLWNAATTIGLLLWSDLCCVDSGSLWVEMGLLERGDGGSALEWYNPDAFTPDLPTIPERVVIRPVRILLTEPLVIIVAFISAAVSWGMIYLFTEALTPIYASMGFSKTQASAFVGWAVGVVFTFLPRVWDMRVVRRRKEREENIQPEDKSLPGLSVRGSHTLDHSDLGSGTGRVCAVNEMAYMLSGYLADSYLLFSASAFSGLALIRALVSGAMPLIALEMHGGLDANAAGSVLAGVSLLFCAAPWIFWMVQETEGT